MAQQFPLMRLPLELRLCVYEQIAISQVQKHINLGPSLLGAVVELTSRHPGVVIRNGEEQPACRKTDVILHVSAVPVGILATCRQVNQEAAPFINRLKKDVFRSRVTIDCHWNRPELTYYLPLIVPPIGPQLTNKRLHEHVLAAFPGSDAFSQQAICQLMLRSMMKRSPPPSERGSNPGDITCRVLYIHDKDETHDVLESMTEAYLTLGRCLNYIDYRKRKLFRGEKDPGKANVAYRSTHVVIKVGDNFDAFLYKEVINDGTRILSL